MTSAGSFNDWTTPVPLRQAYENGDHVRSVVLAPGPVTYKFVTNSVWRHSPRDTVCVDSKSNSINNQKVVAINSTITWRARGSEDTVFVAGSFLAWAEIVPLTRSRSGDFSVNCCLPVRLPLHRLLSVMPSAGLLLTLGRDRCTLVAERQASHPVPGE